MNRDQWPYKDASSWSTLQEEHESVAGVAGSALLTEAKDLIAAHTEAEADEAGAAAGGAAEAYDEDEMGEDE
jgi:hypothetical protein